MNLRLIERLQPLFGICIVALNVHKRLFDPTKGFCIIWLRVDSLRVHLTSVVLNLLATIFYLGQAQGR